MSRFNNFLGALAISVGLLVVSGVATQAAVATQPADAAVGMPASGPVRSIAGEQQADRTQQGRVRLAQRGRRGGFRRRGFRGRGFRGRRFRRGRRRGRWIGPAIGAGIAALIIGGAIEASRRDHRDRWERCDDEYTSFRWSDGTFQPYGDGPRELCPYLRDE